MEGSMVMMRAAERAAEKAQCMNYASDGQVRGAQSGTGRHKSRQRIMLHASSLHRMAAIAAHDE